MRSGISAYVWLVALAFATAASVSRPAAADDRQDCLKASKETAAAAIDACTRAIQSQDYDEWDLSDLYHHRGYAWSWTNYADRVDRAFKDYTEAIRIDPKAVSSLLNRSQIYNHRRDYDRAIADVDRAFAGGLSTYGKRVGYGARGYAYQAKGDYERAIADYTDSLQLDANNTSALCARGYAYLVKGDVDRAISDYDQVIALDPSYALAYYNRSVAYREKGDLDRVIADSSQAITLYPRYRDAYANRSYAYRAKGDLDRAIADYDQMITLDPEDKDARNGRSTAYLLKGDFRRSIADLDLEQMLSWIAAIVVLLAVTIWVCSRTGTHARGWLSGPKMIEMVERELAEIRGKNAVIERIALALEKHSSG
ncbi:tetratricopeptide repeat protein [Bradyrhizobium commune]|uniref:Tetratricopeptide repeat protein n=1 Tax=Bradyrhizobium commune TaxID=83627 RepID=A0A7S9D9H3_9BRAD|nr:tetratricopeptide repeat protein [Bradyrhizobium commune]QPF92944.1 tetratricopeptide repeat protein [Bradyrhizobium commune]